MLKLNIVKSLKTAEIFNFKITSQNGSFFKIWKTGIFEKLLCFGRSHSIVTRISVSLTWAPHFILPAFINLNGRWKQRTKSFVSEFQSFWLGSWQVSQKIYFPDQEKESYCRCLSGFRCQQNTIEWSSHVLKVFLFLVKWIIVNLRGIEITSMSISKTV